MILRRVLAGFVIILILLMAYLVLWPVPIEPGSWDPPRAPALEGVYEQNNLLASVERLGEGAGVGPEDVAVDDRGRIYGGMQDGRIIRLQPDGTHAEEFALTGGRPLGMHFDAHGSLIVADAYRGLISISLDGSITDLASEANGVPFSLTDDVDIAKDGTIYFTDASSRFCQVDYMADLIEHRPNGRLLAYYPETKITRVLLDDLYFANGVAVSPDQSFVLVNETGKYRVRRYWLAGPQKGRTDIFIQNLPGFPDGISAGKEFFWLALVTPRDSLLDALLPRPFIRKMVLRLPRSIMPGPKRYGFILGLDRNGNVVHNLQDPSGAFSQITSVQEHEGMLYLGSLVEDAIGRLPLPGR
jgi:sugar lactone lactonase YvrE